MKERLTQKKYAILFVLIIIAQIAVMTFYEKSKQFYHIDELYTFEYAHNVMPVEKNEGNFRIHKQESWYNQWHSKDEFIKHFEVQGDDSILHYSLRDFLQNKQTKNIYYIAMNIASSFQRKAEPSKWTAFYLNVVIFCISQIYIYKIAYEITLNKRKALLAVGVYGFSAGAISLTLYVRFYDLCLLSAILITYFHIKIWRSEKIWKMALNLMGVALAVLMVYANQPYVMTYTACTGLAYVLCCLIYKSKNRLLPYIGLIAGASGISYILLPEVWESVMTMADSGFGREAIANLKGRGLEEYNEYITYYFEKLLTHTLAGGKGTILIGLIFIAVVIYSLATKKIKINVEKYDNKIVLMLAFTAFLFFAFQCKLLGNMEYRYMSYYYPIICILASIGMNKIFDISCIKKTYICLILCFISIIQITVIYCKGYVDELYPGAYEMKNVLTDYSHCDSVLFIEARHPHQYYRDAFLVPDGTEFCAVESLDAMDMDYSFLNREEGEPILCWFPNFSWNNEEDNYKALDKIVNETEYSSYYKILETYQSKVYYLY